MLTDEKQIENFVAAGEKTRFGAEKANPGWYEIEGANEPYTIRRMQTVMMHKKIDDVDMEPAAAARQVLEQVIGNEKATAAQAFAYKVFRKAFAGDMDAIEKITVNTEGKLPDTMNLNTRQRLPEPADLAEAQRQMEARRRDPK